MLQNRRVFTGFFVTSFLIVLAAISGLAAAFTPAESIQNEDSIAGLVDVSMIINPAITTPGEELVLEIRATNRGAADAGITIDSQLPESVSYDIIQIPSSTTFNFQTNQFSWQPIVPAGQTRTFTLPLRAGVADINNPIQRVEASYRYGSIVDEISAEFWVGVLPTVGINSVTEVSVGQPLQLSADIQGPGPFSQRWDLGDGRSFRADDPAISYSAAGDYTIALELANPLGTTVATRTITVKPDPIALFSLSDPTPSIGQSITFLNQSGGEGPLEHYWEFGDGQSALIQQPEHSFDEAGLYMIRLVVENEFGRSETTLPLTIGAAPAVQIDLPDQGVTGESFIGGVAGGDSSAEFMWDAGDGTLHEGPVMRHNYRSAGNYNVTLTASNEFGSTQIVEQVLIERGVLRYFLPVVFVEPSAGPTAETLPQDSAIVITASSGNELSYSTDFGEIDLNADSVPFDSTQEQRLLWYINKARQQEGLPPYAYNEALSQASKRHTNDMAFQRFWGHTGSDGSRPDERQQDAGYVGGYGGEATAWGFEYPSGAVGFWLESPSHRPLILNPNADEVGVAFTYDETSGSIYYWTAEFGRADGGYAYPFFEAYRPETTPTAAAAVAPVQAQPTQPAPTQAPPEPTATPLPLLATATPQPLIEATPTSLPVLETATSQPTQTPVPTQQPDEPTVTPTELVATAEPTATPTEAATATAVPTSTPTPAPTSTPTEVPTSAPPISAATATPLPTATATATPDSAENDRNSAPISAATPTSAPSATPTSDSRSGEAAPEAAEQFLRALLRDPDGYAALPFATYSMQNRLLNDGVNSALGVDDTLSSFVLGTADMGNDGGAVSAELSLSNGTTITRLLSLLFVENQWRVDQVSP